MHQRDPEKYRKMVLDPTLVEVWQTALQKTVKLQLNSRSSVQYLRHRLYQTRLILWAQEHPIYEGAKHLMITVRKTGPETFDLTISAGDDDIKKALKEAGFLKEEPDDDFLNPLK